MIDVTLAVLGSILVGMVEAKAGDALLQGLVKIKHRLRKLLRTAFEKAIDEVISETERSNGQARDALLRLKSDWKTLQVEETAMLNKERVNEMLQSKGLPAECCGQLYDRINEKFLKAFAHIAKKDEDVFLRHVILSLKELERDSREQERNMQSLLAFCQTFGINATEILKELGKLRKDLLRIERKTNVTGKGV